MALTDIQIKEMSLAAAAGHYLCDGDFDVHEQHEKLCDADDCDIPPGVVAWEPFEDCSAGELVENIDCLAEVIERLMLLARDGGEPVPEEPYRPTIAWSAEDVQSLRPRWTIERCQNWLDGNGKYIVDREIELGWDVIETLLPSDDTTTCPHCSADLSSPESVRREYIDKSDDSDDGELSRFGFGHLEATGDYEDDRPACLGTSQSYDLLDNSDTCAACGGEV